MSSSAVQYELRDDVATLRLDDGKVNALSPAVLEAVRAALRQAAKEARAVLLCGRPGYLSAGFDLRVMREGPDSARDLVIAGAEMLLDLYLHPQPVVIACSGHAIAAGALMLLTGDRRLAAQGDFKIGLNEVGVGMSLPIFAIELARAHLSPQHFTAATLHARLYDPAGAAEAGFLDRVCSPEQLLAQAMEDARRLSALAPEAYRASKQRVREPVAAGIRATLQKDVAALTGTTA